MRTILAVVCFVLSILGYTCVFWVADGDQGSYLIRMLDFIAPIFGGGLTLLGVALTLWQQADTQESSFEYQRLLIERDRRISAQPLILHSMEKVPKNLIPETVGQINNRQEDSFIFVKLRIELVGKNIAQKISVATFDDRGRKDGTILEAFVLDEARPEISRHFAVPADSKGRNTYEQILMLEYSDISGHCYQQAMTLCVGSASHYGESGTLLFEYPTVSLSSRGDVRYVGNGRSAYASKENLISIIEDHLKSRICLMERERTAQAELKTIANKIDVQDSTEQIILRCIGEKPCKIEKRLHDITKRKDLLPAGAGLLLVEDYRVDGRKKHLFASVVYSMEFSGDDGFTAKRYEWKYIVKQELSSGCCSVISKSMTKDEVSKSWITRLFVKWVFATTPPFPVAFFSRISCWASKNKG